MATSIAQTSDYVGPREVIYSLVKPLDKPRRASYLNRSGLATWLKIRLRSNSLPLLAILVRYCSAPSSAAACRLCNDGDEDVFHFLVVCPALEAERSEFSLRLSSDSAFADLSGSAAMSTVWRSGTPLERVKLLLQSHEASIGSADDPDGDEKEQLSDHDRLVLRFESLSMPLLVALWKRRAVLLGGVPVLDVTGTKLTMSALRDDGRCRSFAAGSHASPASTFPSSFNSLPVNSESSTERAMGSLLLPV